MELLATYNDLDNEKPVPTVLTWKWYLGNSPIPGAGTSTCQPHVPSSPIGRGSLRVEASYTKTDGTTKTVSKTVSVRAKPTAANAEPNFGVGPGARSVDENSPPGTRVGKPVTAIDTGDKLTYTLSGSDQDGNYRIDAATGQITVGPRTLLDR